MKKIFYSTLTEAQQATQALAISTMTQYKQRYREDPCLPSNPKRIYANEWQNWPTFLGEKIKNFYPTFTKAQQATRALAILTIKEYQQRYQEDPRLPSCPNLFYAEEWQNWPIFLGKEVKYFYPTLSEAQQATRKLTISTQTEYQQRYREDPLLPCSPDSFYTDEWHNWSTFLGKKVKEFYPSLVEAQQATRALVISTEREYKQRYHEDPLLPASPHIIYINDWQNWPTFFGKKIKNYYPNLAEAQQAARTLKIYTEGEYRKRYKENPRLPSCPNTMYIDEWHCWSKFLRNEIKSFYPTLAIAQHAIRKLAISSSLEYGQRYHEDPHLPSSPKTVYANEWHNWSIFLGKKIRNFYPSIIEAQQAARNLTISTITEYRQRYREDPRLPSTPNNTYASEWKSWPIFLDYKKKKFYPTLSEAQNAVKALAISTIREYKRRYREDPRLPSMPIKIYASEWQCWAIFLNKEIKNFYPTITEAQNAVKALAISTIKEYKQRYHEDPRLPSNPSYTYSNEWTSWPEFLDKKIRKLYSSITEAQQAVHVLAISTIMEYQQRYREDPHLPVRPNTTYSKEWQNWQAFLLPKIITNLKNLKLACKTLDIKNSQQYKQVQKQYKQLPAHPDRKFKDWLDWFDLLDIPQPYPYDTLREIVLKHKCFTLDDYRVMRAKLNDPHIPASPIEFYKNNGWSNTYDFFGVPRPYQVKYFTPEWKMWGDSITEFLKSAKGSSTKARDLCEFVREYIEPNGFETSPVEYLTRGKTNIQPMLSRFEEVTVIRKKKCLYSINEFLDWIIVNFLTIEDSETGEVSRIKGAKNPFSNINFDGEQAPQSMNETNKLALPYQFVKSAREWIFPHDSMAKNNNFSDLAHLHRFSADWIIIDDVSLINKKDPDCVTKTDGEKTYLWLPIYWVYTYALMQLPARGRQIVYCDSGEADSEIAEIKNGKLAWKRNKNRLAGSTFHQGMVCKTKDNDFGVYYTSNKTSFNGQGYAIPFMPQELAYWLIKLRKWQEKYNPIERPTRWLDCNRTYLNETQRKQKGINCFLFRDYQVQEPGTFGGRLASRLAAALFYSSNDQLVLATYAGQSFQKTYHQLENQEAITLRHFKSEYTPHSMRVSLINAYAYEFGMSIEVIMKLVGHSSILMSIYYMKTDKTGVNIRERMQLGEKKALSKGAETLRGFIEQQRIEECKQQLFANNSDFLLTLNNGRPASSYLFKDFGICPVGGAYCSEGGNSVAIKANIYHPVCAGYLGEQNCIQCRFFVTGPAFMIGLAALFNEISLAVNTQSQRYAAIESQLNDTITKIEVISHQIYQRDFKVTSEQTIETEKQLLQSHRRKLNSEIETRAKKMDLYMADMNAINKHLDSCQKIINQQHNTDNSKLQLIVPHEFEISFELDDVSGFQQLSEVCENAELFHSCNDELAVTRRSQALDKMLLNNGMHPQFIFLTEEQQLVVGNQMTQLMLSRLQSWERVDRLINGSLELKDLNQDEEFTASDIKQLFANSTPLKLVN